MTKQASILEVMNYFEETSKSKFAREWKELSIDDKEEIKTLVGAVIHKS